MIISSPVGPVGMLCVRRVIDLGLRGGIAIALGTACADSLFAIIAAAGSAALEDYMLTYKGNIELVIGAVFIFLSLREFFCYRSYRGLKEKKGEHKKLTVEVLFLTLSNPLIIFLFIGLFSMFSPPATVLEVTIWLLIGIFSGSFTWWVGLALIFKKIEHLFSEKAMDRVRYVASVFLLLCGICFIGSYLFGSGPSGCASSNTY